MSKIFDGLANLVSRLGTAADRRTSTVWTAPTFDIAQIESAYRSNWLTRKVHDLPPFEMTRAGRDWQAEKEQIEALEKEEKRLGVWPKMQLALRTARLVGGAAIIMGTRTAPELELDPETVKKGGLLYLAVVSRLQIDVGPEGFERDVMSPYFNRPKMFQLASGGTSQARVHPSRVITFHGAPLIPGMATVSETDSFWGDPLLFSIRDAVENATTGQDAVASLLHELKQDVISIPGLTESIAAGGDTEALIGKRIEALNTFRSMFNALLLDGGDDEGKGGEKWETRQLSFQQHPELLQHFLAVVGGASDIPVTRLLGTSPGGLQSTGKGEQDDFDRMIAARQSEQLAPAFEQLDPMLIPSALGNRPPEIYYEFAPLRPVDEAQHSEVEKREAETVHTYQQTGLIPLDALAKATQNRMVESGRWPGLDKALEESEAAGDLPDMGNDETDAAAQEATRAQKVDKMERAGVVNRDQAIALLADAEPRSLYVSRRLLNASDVIAWARAQGFEQTLTADEMHVTIAYSRAPVDWFAVGESWDYRGDDGKLTIQAGGARLVEPLGESGAVVLLFASSTLSYRHEEIKRAGASWDHPEYQPHVTLTYAVPDGFDLASVEPYRGRLVFGPEIFEQVDPDFTPLMRKV